MFRFLQPGGNPVLPDIHKRIIIPENVLYQEIKGEGVLLSLDSETYFGLDEVGNRMWTVLQSTGSIQAACDILLEEFDVDSETLQQDLQSFVLKLENYGLLDVVD
jgi:hypothetical protein